jgi:hypothetical protein
MRVLVRKELLPKGNVLGDHGGTAQVGREVIELKRSDERANDGESGTPAGSFSHLTTMPPSGILQLLPVLKLV